MQERVDKTNWKYMLRNRIAGIRPFAWCFKGEPAFEEGQEELAFQMVVLLRKIHDANGAHATFSLPVSAGLTVSCGQMT